MGKGGTNNPEGVCAFGVGHLKQTVVIKKKGDGGGVGKDARVRKGVASTLPLLSEKNHLQKDEGEKGEKRKKDSTKRANDSARRYMLSSLKDERLRGKGGGRKERTLLEPSLVRYLREQRHPRGRRSEMKWEATTS